MTRRFRPPAPINVCCGPDGLPERVRRGGRERVVTHIVATWVRPAPWWTEVDGAAPDPLQAERTYAKIVLDGLVVYDVFSVNGGAAWFVERILD